MVFALLGALIFLGIFAEDFNEARHQEMALKACGSKANIQAVSSVNFSCNTTNNTQIIGKG